MSDSLEISDHESSGPDSIDSQAFAQLFHNFKLNETAIWQQMVALVKHVARRHIRGRSLDEMDEIKGDALTVAMEIAKRPVPPKSDTGAWDAGGFYDPARNSAYEYFYSVVKNHMLYLAGKAREEMLGDFDGEVSFHDLREVQPKDAGRYARANCPNNWRRRLRPSPERYLVEKYLKMVIAKSKKSMDESRRAPDGKYIAGSAGEAAMATATIEIAQQMRRALLG